VKLLVHSPFYYIKYFTLLWVLILSNINLEAKDSLDIKTDSLLTIVNNTEDDSLKFQIYQKLMVAYTNIDVERSVGYCKKMIKVGYDSDNDVIKALSHGRYSVFKTVEGILDTALIHAQLGYEFARKSRDITAMACAEHALGWYYAYNGNYPLAQEYYQKSIDKYEIVNQEKGLKGSILKMALLYMQMEEFQKAKVVLEEIIERYPDDALFNFYFALAHGSLDENEKAKQYFNKYLDLTKDLPYNFRSANVEAELFRLDGDMEKEEDRRRYVLEEVDRVGKPMMKHREAQKYASFLIRKNRNKEAISLLEKRKLYKPDQIKPAHRLQYYLLLKNAYSAIADYKNALKYSDLYQSTQEKYSKQHNIERIIDREKNLEFERKDKTILDLKKEQESKSKKINLLWLSLISILGLLSLSIFLFVKNKSVNLRLQKQNVKLDNALGEQQTLLQETHHRVKNNLQIISSLLNLQRKYIDDKYMTSILVNSRNRVKSMALIHQMLYQNKLSYGINVKEYTETLSNSILSSFRDKSDQIEIINDVDDLKIHEDTINPIGLIINELVTNSIKYAFPDERKGIIRLSLNLVDDKLILKVSDDGVGIQKPLEDLDSGFGHSLVKSLTKKLKATIDVDSTNGTQFTITISHFELVG